MPVSQEITAAFGPWRFIKKKKLSVWDLWLIDFEISKDIFILSKTILMNNFFSEIILRCLLWVTHYFPRRK